MTLDSYLKGTWDLIVKMFKQIIVIHWDKCIIFLHKVVEAGVINFEVGKYWFHRGGSRF